MRLFRARANITEFNKVFQRIMDPAPLWTIEQSDQGTYYLKTDADGQYHNSDGREKGSSACCSSLMPCTIPRKVI